MLRTQTSSRRGRHCSYVCLQETLSSRRPTVPRQSALGVLFSIASIRRREVRIAPASGSQLAASAPVIGRRRSPARRCAGTHDRDRPARHDPASVPAPQCVPGHELGRRPRVASAMARVSGYERQAIAPVARAARRDRGKPRVRVAALVAAPAGRTRKSRRSICSCRFLGDRFGESASGRDLVVS